MGNAGPVRNGRRWSRRQAAAGTGAKLRGRVSFLPVSRCGMGEARAGGGLYRRLIERIACALAGAEAVRRRDGAKPAELALHELSSAERALIRAWLRRDLQWLRGWQAAAEELALIEREERAVRVFVPADPPAGTPRMRPLRHPGLFCALCGRAVRQRRAGCVAACPACASRLFLVGRRQPRPENGCR